MEAQFDFFVCVCEREVVHTLGNTHISQKIPFPIWCEGMPNWMAGGWVRLNLNRGLDLSLKEMQMKRKEIKMVHFLTVQAKIQPITRKPFVRGGLICK